MRFFRVVVIALVSLLICDMHPTEAARRPHAFTLSPLGGIHVFEGNQDLRSSAVFSLGAGYNFSEQWSGEFLAGYIDSKSYEQAPGDGSESVDGYQIRLDFSRHFFAKERFVPYLGVGLGGLLLDDAGGTTEFRTLASYGGGGYYYFSEDVALRIDLKHLLLAESLRFREGVSNHFVAQAGLSFQFGGDVDPPPQVDTDGDGVIDSFDRCPGTRLGIRVDAYGCPADSDHDSVPDSLDKCPETPSGLSVGKDGCLPDSDQDGIQDIDDECPDTAAGIAVNQAGCSRDSDDDGVPDHIDDCGDSPQGEPVDSKGCPTAEPVRAGEDVPKIELRLPFSPGEASIQAEFSDELERAVEFVSGNPSGAVLVEGHTDSVGSAQYNLELSRRRAHAVREYLLEHTPIESSRIKAVGYGETRPAADNATQAGRQTNRRVVIRLLSELP